MGKIARKLMWAVAGTAASRVARSYTRRTLYDRSGAPRLPRKVRRKGGMGMLGWAVATGVCVAVSDLMRDQGKGTLRPW